MRREGSGSTRVGVASAGDIRREMSRFHSFEPDDELVGKTIHDHYEILGKIGGGGMGNIYLALDRETHERVAVKVLTETGDKQYKWTERFFVEAKAAIMIDHPNVIQIMDVGSFGNRIFCVMELLQGEDLFKKLDREKKLPWELAKPILEQICDALDAAHSKGVLHRDMKPANVIVVNNNGYPLVKVLDFGLAKIMGNDDNITREGLIMGTPKYMAPEQAWGGKKYDHRADIYSLGALMYEMLTGKVPFESDAEDERARILGVLLMHKETPPRPPRELDPSISPEVEAVVMKALQKDPASRFQSALEMKAAIRACGPDSSGIIDSGEEQAAEPTEISAPAAEDSGSSDPATGPSEPGAREPQRKDEMLDGRLSEIIDNLPDFKKGRRKGGFIGKLLLVTALAGGVAAYHYRDRIRSAYDGAFPSVTAPAQHLEPTNQAPQHPVPSSPSAGPSARTSEASTFQITVDSNPRAASVYDVTGGANELIGSTPLERRVAMGEHTLILRKRGYADKRVTINPDNPSLNVPLSRVRRAPAPSASESNEAGGTDSTPAPAPSDSER